MDINLSAADERTTIYALRTVAPDHLRTDTPPTVISRTGTGHFGPQNSRFRSAMLRHRVVIGSYDRGLLEAEYGHSG
jgi:hypothetical protein